MNNIAVILAGGTGIRLDKNYPKQLHEIAGKTILEHTVQAFENHPDISEILIVFNLNYLREIEEIITKNKWEKVCRVVPGGSSRTESSINALRALNDRGEVNVLFHDAVRPLVSPAIIDRVIAALKQYSAVATAVFSTDTLLEVVDNKIVNIPDRSRFYRAQTPQGFRLSVLREAYDKALLDPNLQATDDCGIIRRYLPETEIFVVPGDESNLKVTYPEDLFILEHRLNNSL
jgi:2-C-methyl-D-erythritol 4-phosphate cytidylyltransferase